MVTESMNLFWGILVMEGLLLTIFTLKYLLLMAARFLHTNATLIGVRIAAVIGL